MNTAIILEKMEIKDNTFARQFETLIDGKLISVEYSFQEKKIFLTRINVFDGFDNEEFISDINFPSIKVSNCLAKVLSLISIFSKIIAVSIIKSNK